MGSLILLIDDDPHISEVIDFALVAAGFSVIKADNGQSALELFREKEPALAIVDINLPGRDGLWLCRQIREFSDTPIIFLSARDEEVDRVMGLTIGGDDYITKPFSPRELVARIEAVLRRPRSMVNNQSIPPTSRHWHHGPLSMDQESFETFWNDRLVELTATEFKLLKTFILRPKKVFSREELLDIIYPDTSVSDRTIDSHILHIRKKFQQQGAGEIIITQHGLGYSLAPTSQEPGLIETRKKS